MAYDMMGIDITARSSGDTSAYQYHCVVLSTTNNVDGCVMTTDENQMAIGIWQNNSTRAEDGKVRVLGVSKAVVTAVDTAVAPMTRLSASTTVGHLEVHDVSNGQIACALSLGILSTGSTGIISVFVLPGPGSTST